MMVIHAIKRSVRDENYDAASETEIMQFLEP